MQTINSLWSSSDRAEWSDACARYWTIPSVRKNIELEKRMDKLRSETIEGFGEREWYNFLREEYFPWKFTGNYLPRRLDDLEKNGIENLFIIMKRLFTFDLASIREGLRIAREINGLGPAGASGLLAVLFPKWFGTADKFVTKSLCEIKLLPERQELLAMARKDLKGRDVPLSEKGAAVLIDIMRRKAAELNHLFGRDEWTPRKIDMILWASREETDVQCSNRIES